jgi:hypothetical protein
VHNFYYKYCSKIVPLNLRVCIVAIFGNVYTKTFFTQTMLLCLRYIPTLNVICLMTNAHELLLPHRTANMDLAPNASTNIIYFSNIPHHIIFQYGLHTLNNGAVTPT